MQWAEARKQADHALHFPHRTLRIEEPAADEAPRDGRAGIDRWWNGVVPWCPTCDRFLSPPTVNEDGTCPTCGATVDPGKAAPVASATATGDLDGAPAGRTGRRQIPWHLKALLGVFAIYLGYRTFQGLEWLVQQL